MNISNISAGFSANVSEKRTVVARSDKVLQKVQPSRTPIDVEIDTSFDPTLLRRVVDQIKSTFNMFDTRLHFKVNMQANNVVVEVVDSKTNAVIKQIPSEEMQELKKKIEEMTGAFVDLKI